MPILDWSLKETGYATVAIKTTGLTHGYDRICEVAVALAVPGQPVRLVLDSLVNPEREMGGTEVHGIKPHQITKSAPVFKEVALDLLRGIQGRVIVGHNLHFTMQFLKTEFADLDVPFESPYVDTMNLTSMLTKSAPRPLLEACDTMGFEPRMEPTAAAAALDTARLYRELLLKLSSMRLTTFKHIRGKGRFAFQKSLELDPMPKGFAYDLKESVARISRHEEGVEGIPNLALALYWDSLMVALDDLVITEAELTYLKDVQKELEIDLEDAFMLHAKVFSGALVQMIKSGTCTQVDRDRLAALQDCLYALGWSPGTDAEGEEIEDDLTQEAEDTDPGA